MDIEEIKELMIAGIKRNEQGIQEEMDDLEKTIASMDSIEEVLKMCGKYF